MEQSNSGETLCADLKTLSVPMDGWYKLTSDRNEWCCLYNEQLSYIIPCKHPGPQGACGNISCECGRSFHQ